MAQAILLRYDRGAIVHCPYSLGSGAFPDAIDMREEQLDAEHADVAEEMVRKLARKRDVPFMRGARKNWAAAIVHALCQINFGYDRSHASHTTLSALAAHFVKTATITSKAQAVRKMLGARQFGQTFNTAKNRATGAKLNAMLRNPLIVIHSPTSETDSDLTEGD